MPQLEFRCARCRQSFFVPSEVIPASGGRGRCTGCGAPLVIFPDGRIVLAPSPSASATPPPAPQQDPQRATDAVWEIRSTSPDGSLSSPGPFTLADLKEKVEGNLLFEGDMARVLGGDWQPVRSYPALMQFFLERLQRDRQEHGDEEHCALHREEPSEWWCPKCRDYLCRQCVVNRPVLAGGAAHFICLDCEMDVEPVRRSMAKNLMPGFLKRR